MNCSSYSCSAYASTGRSFLTKEEKLEMLQEYKENLEQEVKGVVERIAELQKLEKSK